MNRVHHSFTRCIQGVAHRGEGQDVFGLIFLCNNELYIRWPEMLIRIRTMMPAPVVFNIHDVPICVALRIELLVPQGTRETLAGFGPVRRVDAQANFSLC